MSTTPSRCRQRASVSTTRPRIRTRADNARPHPRGAPALRPSALRTRSTWTRPTTPAAPGARPHQAQTPGGLLRIAHHPLGVRTQGPRFKKHAPHTRAGSSPCVRRVLRKPGSLCAQPGGQGPQRPHWNRGGASAGARCRRRDGVVNIVRGSSTTPRGGYWRREGVIGAARGLSTL